MRLYAGLLVGWTILIFWATLSPSENLPETGLFQFPYFDKAAHFGLFTVFSFLLSGVLWHLGKTYTRKSARLVTVIVIAILLSLLIEFAQKMIPGRDFEILDIMANLTGSLVGVLAFNLKLKKISDSN